MIDCLIIGHNDGNFSDYNNFVKSMGEYSAAYRDLSLAFIEDKGKPYRALDCISRYNSQLTYEMGRPFNNTDFLSPAILVLGSYLAKKKFTFDYINLFQFEKEKLKNKLLSQDILSIAITTTLYVTPQPILELVSFIRMHSQQPKIIVGGPYIRNQTTILDNNGLQRLFKYIDADYYVDSSEGEFALSNILTSLKNAIDINSIDNIAYKKGEGYHITNKSVEYNEIEDNPDDYSLFPASEFDKFVSIRTSKSCPFSCSFCGFPARAGQYKYLSVDLVEAELDKLRDIGTISTVTFIDDTFNVPKGRFKDILRMMIRNQYGFHWNCFYRCDHGDEETIELMAEAGCEGVFLGIESGSDTILEKMNKSARRKDYKKSIPLLKQAGIITYASLIIGFPGETFATIRETSELVEETQPDFFRAQLWYADPSTPIWQQREDLNIRGSAFNWTHDTMTSEIASDIVERMFLSIENSVWLPQYGFEPWSVYYLRRQGMSIAQIKNVLRSFNAVIKEHLLFPKKKRINPALLHTLQRDCRLDLPPRSERDAAEIFPAAAYADAEQYCLAEFDADAPPYNIEAMDRHVRPAGSGPAVLECPIDDALLNRLTKTFAPDSTALFLAAYSVLLSRLSGREDVVVVAAGASGGECDVCPIRLYPGWDLSFETLAAAIREKLQQSLAHQSFMWRILTNPLWQVQYGRRPMVFDIGFVRSTQTGDAMSTDEAQDDGWQCLRSSYPRIYEGMGLILQVHDDERVTRLSFQYEQSWFKPGTIARLRGFFLSILEDVCTNPERCIGEIMLDREAQDHDVGPDLATDSDRDDVFKF